MCSPPGGTPPRMRAASSTWPWHQLPGWTGSGSCSGGCRSRSANLWGSTVIGFYPAGTPAGLGAWWQISTDRDARLAAADMVVQLADHGWPPLTRVLNRQALLDSIRAGDLGFMKAPHVELFFVQAEAVLIAEDGA